MEKTPVLKTKSSEFHRTKFDSRNISTHNNNESFTRNDTNTNYDTDNEESPMQIACTQEENIDVVWDWNSPQAKKYPKKCQKRLLLPRSPKIPLKRHPSNNSIKNFEKLKEELQALRREIALPENEDSLILSPREEADYKSVQENPVQFEEFNDECLDDIFSDKLVELSEEKSETVNSAKKKINFKKSTNESHVKLANDSFESLLNDIDIETLTCPFNEEKNITSSAVKTNSHETRSLESTNAIKETVSTADQRRRSNYTMQYGKVEFHRTQSFEHSADIPKYKLDEIEKKRQEAKAKLEMKRKLDQTTTFSQSQCSSEEIESKRLQALAKLEAKRQQDIIERKRQDALKRLQINRRKNAMIVKSSLTQRLD